LKNLDVKKRLMVATVNDMAARIAKSVYALLHRRESLLKKGARYLRTIKGFRPVFKPSPDGGLSLTVEPESPHVSGIDLLDKVMEDLGEFIRLESGGVHIVFDEFQEITEIKDVSVEGETLPHDELSAFLVDQFGKGGKRCAESLAEKIANKVAQYPYYAQLLAYYVFEVSGRTVKEEDVEAGFEKLLASERYGYEAIVQGLTGPQISLLRALATDPDARILSAEYMGRHKLTIGGVQYARDKLEALDLIEKHDNIWRIVDPVFAAWLLNYA